MSASRTIAVVVAACACACGPAGSPPQLQEVGDQVVAVNQELVLVLAATDEDGDELDYDYSAEVPDLDGRASISALPVGAGEFRWTPLAADEGVWLFEFSVSDGVNRDTVSAHIDVRSAVGENSAPRFLHPQGMGTTFDLTVDSCIDIDIEVIDDDSTEVALSQLEPLLDGAELVQTDSYTGTWHWCPTEAQVEADDRYTVVFGADDGDNPRSVHPYLLVLRRPTKPDCPGGAPAVDHTPEDVSTVAGLRIPAVISDDLGLKNEPLFYYSTTAPSDPPDLASMTQLTMQLTGGNMASGTWTATVPNPVAAMPAGSNRTLHYVIVASDDDDVMGSCDHLTQAPASGAFQMTVTNPGGEGGEERCEPCTHDVQCGGTADLCVRLGTSGEAFCASDCDAPSDCPADYTCTPSAVTSVDGASRRQCVPQSNDCSDPGGGVCVDDIREDNHSREQALTRPLLGKGTHELVSCPAAVGTGDDEDWFEIAVELDTTVTVSIDGSDSSDLDLALYTREGSLVASSTSFTSSETVSRCLTPGRYLIRVLAWSAVRNPYQLVLSRSVGTCAATCEVDENEEDDSAAQARTTDISPDPFVSTTQSICAADDDWYEVELANNDLLVVDLVFEQTASNEDLDIHLYEGATDLTPCSPAEPDSCLLDNGQSADSDEHFEAQAPSSGCPCTYFVVVRGYDGSENLYDISIEAQ